VEDKEKELLLNLEAVHLKSNACAYSPFPFDPSHITYSLRQVDHNGKEEELELPEWLLVSENEIRILLDEVDRDESYKAEFVLVASIPTSSVPIIASQPQTILLTKETPDPLAINYFIGYHLD